MRKLYRVHEFAELPGIMVQTLPHYDRLDVVMHPEH